jgi:oligoendopeptidase F
MKLRSIALALALATAFSAVASAQKRDRAAIDDKYKWKLSDIYASDDVWRAEKEKLAKRIPQLAAYQGTLGQSPAKMLEAADAITAGQKELYRLYVYASMHADTDTRDAKYEGMRQEMNSLFTEFSAATAWMQPEVLALGKAKVDEFLKAEPKLEIYRLTLDDIVRRQAHTGTPGEEKIIADAGLATSGAASAQNIFANADFPYPTVKLSDGREVKLNQSGFGVERGSANRADRKLVFESFFGEIGRYKGTFGALLNAKVQNDLFYMKAQKYDSTLAAALDGPNLPVGVYHALIDGVNKSLPSFHRYLRLRARMLGVEQLHYYDLYAPLVGSVNDKYPIEVARKHITASMAPLGSDYVAVVNKALDERWIDLYPTEGKRSGAYSNGGAYDIHPYMLLNYNDKYDDMSTLTHELGHTMQSYYSNKTQPFVNAGYPTFVAEVASTFNEALLVDYMLKNVKDRDTKLVILGNYLEGIKGTVFRQTQFAEFELRMHEMAEKGEPLTGEALDKLYLDIVRRYYGHDAGACVVDDVIQHEWAYIPHFYRNYYVFQYATSFTASAALSEKVMAGDKAAVKRYRDFLAAGGSKYPIDLLKDAGVDMTTSEPLDFTVKKMNRVMDEMEKLLNEKK